MKHFYTLQYAPLISIWQHAFLLCLGGAESHAEAYGNWLVCVCVCVCVCVSVKHELIYTPQCYVHI